MAAVISSVISNHLIEVSIRIQRLFSHYADGILLPQRSRRMPEEALVNPSIFLALATFTPRFCDFQGIAPI